MAGATMSLSDLASLGSFVSGAAVLGSLVLLYFQLRQLTGQVRQAERNQQGALRQGRASGLMEWNLRLSDPLVADVNLRVASGKAKSPSEIGQFMAIARAGFQLYEDSFDQHEAGLMTEQAFASFERNAASSFSVPGYRVAWIAIRDMFGARFAAHMDRIMAETAPRVVPGTIEQWNAAVAAEIASASQRSSG